MYPSFYILHSLTKNLSMKWKRISVALYVSESIFFFVYNVNCEIVTILGPDCFGVKWKSGNTNSRT